MIKTGAAGALAVFLLFSLATQQVSGEVFEYKHKKGDRYRILSVVNQEVFVNRALSHRAEILNRIAVEVTDEDNGKGTHRAIFQTSERGAFVSSNRNKIQVQGTQPMFQWAREYESIFDRDKLGFLTIDPKYYMPVVRNVPVFPGRDIEPGEKWSADGYEMHDFRDGFDIQQPYRIPFSANYTFLGDRQWKEETYPAFSVNYVIFFRPQPVKGKVWPSRIMGSSNQIVYWDIANGHDIAYEETFTLTFELSDGRVYEFKGTAQAEIIESEYMNREELVFEIAEEIDRLELPDVNVRAVEEGVTISLENVGFYPDSSVMLPGEIEKLEKIADILKRYSERDIIVSGHTALAGTHEGRMTLSVERAKAVTDFLLSKEVRGADRIVIRGYGAEMPIADNNTEEGRRKNRRVEITILEN